MLRGVPDSVLLSFQFGFMNGSSFEPCSDRFGRVCYVVAFQIRLHSFQFSFMNGSSLSRARIIFGRVWLRGCVPDSVS